MLLRLVPLVAGLLPIIAVNLSYLIAAAVGRVPKCVPYLDGCASISATGRHPPSSYVFKAVMLPEAVLMAVYWLLAVAWLRSLERLNGADGTGGKALGTIGASASLFLVLYVTFLGTHGPFYEFMRRFGVYFFFLHTVVAQIMLARALLGLPSLDARVRRITRIQLALALVPFGLGVLNLILKSTLEDPDPSENVIEWLFALMMQTYIVLSYFAWRATGFRASYSVSTSPRA